MKRTLIAVLSLVAVAARAEPHAAAYDAYVAGDYAHAAETALAAGGAEDLALAARALNAASYFEGGRRAARRTADDAYDIARKAIALDPGLPEAHLQAAIALALKGARTSPFRAFVAGLPARARREIDAALAIDPQNAWALSTSAAWRIEVARRGGGSIYGADPEAGRGEFMRARTIAPDNIAIAFECALRLLADGRPEWRADALAALDAALAATPATAFERGVQSLAREFTAAIAEGPDAERAFIERQP